MAQTISEAQRETQKAKEQIEKTRAAIPQITQRQLRGQVGGKGLEGRKMRGQLEELKGRVSAADTQITKREKVISDFLKTDAGKLQYAREHEIQPEVITGRVVKGGTIETLGFRYETPFGTVTDFSPRDSLERQQKILEQIESGERAAVGSAFGLSSPEKLEAAGVDFRQVIRDARRRTDEIKKTTIRIDRNERQILSPIMALSVTEDLKGKKGLEVNGAADVLGGSNLLVRGVSRVRDFIGDNIIGSSKDFSRAEEIFSPELGAFVSASEPSGQATGIIRPPTIQERAAITSAEVRGSGQFIESLVLPASIINRPLMIKDTKDAQRIANLLEKSRFGAAGGLGSVRALEELATISKEAKETTILGPGERITSVGEILRQADQTQKIRVGGFDVRPKTAERLLQFGVKAVETEAVVLGFQLGGAALVRAGLAPTITGSVTQLKVLKGVSGLSTGIIGTSAGAGAGFQVFRQTGDIGSGVAAGLGAGAGFFGSVFSRDIIRAFKSVGEAKGVIGKRARSGAGPKESEYIEVVDKRTGMVTFVKKSTLKPTFSREQAVGEFGRATQQRQINILRKAFKDRVYISENAFREDVNRAIAFMRGSGLTDAQIKANIVILFPQLAQKSTVVSQVSVGVAQATKPITVQSTGFQPSQVGRLAPVQVTQQVQASNQLFGPSQISEQKFIQKSRQQIKQEQLQQQKTGQLFAPSQLFRQLSRQQIKQEQLQQQKTGQLFAPSQLFRQNQISTPSQLTFQPQQTKPKQPTKPLKPTKPRKPLKPTSGLLSRLSEKAAKEDTFKIFARKGGKDVVVAKAKTEAEAFKKLKKKLKGTLRASGFVEKAGKKVSIPLFLNGEFRKSKVDSFRVVEKKGRRLRKRTTGKQIQVFRPLGGTRKNSKKKNSLFGF